MARSVSKAAPWYIWLAILSVTSAMVGTHWDISWHRSIGRDTFWTPAHVAIYLCGVLSGISCGYLILATTFGKSEAALSLRAASVNLWGFHGPLGAFIAAWGGFAMLASAPFDDWWHSAYGLDVKILSPPHMVLALGINTVEIGALILILGQMNRSSGAARKYLEKLFLYIAGMIVVALLLVSLEYSGRVIQHSGIFYRVVCMLVPGVIAMASRATGHRWAATIATGVYTILMLGLVWILPLFPAEPKLGPVYYPVTHFVPSGFPLLISAGDGAGLAVVADVALGGVEAIVRFGRRVPGGAAVGAMAVRDLFAVSGGAESGFRQRVLRLSHQPGELPAAVFVSECGADRGGFLGRTRVGAGLRDRDDAFWNFTRELDAPGAAVTRWGLILLALVAIGPMAAHVGSPDVFFDGMAGPYPVLIVIRPPVVIPGTARVEVRMAKAGARQVKILPLPLSGNGSKFPPTADVAVRDAVEPNLFSGQLWLMAMGSWQVRVSVDGELGSGVASVPVPAVASQTKGMDRGLGRVLFGLMIFLVFGMVSIVGAAVRESTLPPGVAAGPMFGRRTVVAMAVALLVMVSALYGGSRWWGSEADAYGRKVYKPLGLAATIEPGNVMALRLTDPGWLAMRKVDDLEPDHGHLMHLYAIREPEMDAVFHLHPEQVHAGAFELALPPMPGGRYRLFADIVHEGGFGETPVSEVEVSGTGGTPLAGDNAGGPVHAGEGVSALSDGTRMVWLRDSERLRAGQVHRFTFRMEDGAGHPVSDLEPYMGMAGHAAFVDRDFSTFAHLHPVGSASMPALMLAASASAPESMAAMHEMPRNGEVSFPYAFPKAGRYRIFVQMKRAGRIETGAFDVDVVD